MNDDLPLADLYADRERAIEDARWEITLTKGVQVDASGKSLDKAAEGGKAMPKGGKAIQPAMDSRDLADLREPTIRGVLDTATKTLTGGMSFDELEQAIREGTLPDKVSSLADPIGNTFSAVAKKTAQDQGLAPELVDKIGGVSGVLAGMMMPPGPKAKAAKVGAEALINAPKTASAVNLSRVQASNSVKGTMAAVSQLVGGPKKVVTHGQTLAEVRSAGMTLEDALRLDPQKFDMRAAQVAVRDFNVAASEHLEGLVKKTLAGDATAGNQLWSAFTVAGELSIRHKGLGEVSGRGLESFKILAQGQRAKFDPESLAGLAEVLKGSVEGDAVLLAKRLDALSKAQQKEFVRQVTQATKEGKPNLLYELWMNMLLSGPATHAANSTSGALVAVWSVPERMFAAMASQAEQFFTFGRHPREVFYGEAAALLFGYVMGQKQAILKASAAIKTGVSGIGAEKVELGADAIKQLMLQGDNPVGHATGFWASLWRTPTRMLTAEDAYFKWVNFNGEMWAQGYREAALQGKTGRAFVDELFRVVREKPTLAVQRSNAVALANTLNRDFDDLGRIGRVGSRVYGTTQDFPMLRLIAPFIRTPTNAVHYTLDRVPLLNAFSDTLREDMKAGGDRRALAVGRIMGGASIASVMMWYASAGLFTGGGPRDPDVKRAMRETGWQPYSLKIGETYYSYNRLDPIGALIGTVADASEIMGHLPEYRAKEVGIALSLALARNMTSKTYLEGVTNVLEALERPDRDAGKIISGLSRTLVPTIVRSAERATDPTLRDPAVREDAALREVQEFLNELRAVIPGLSSSLPPRRNIFGEPIILPSAGWGYDMVSPIYTSPTKDDPVAKEIARLKLSLNMPQRTIFGRRVPHTRLEDAKPEEGVELTPWEYDEFLRLAGYELKDASGLGMKETLAQTIASEDYQRQSSEMKKVLITKIVMKFREAARGKLLENNPGVEEAVVERLEKRANSLRPPETQGSGLGPSLNR